MSNAFKITDVVDEKAFNDLKKLNQHLIDAKAAYVDAATEMSKGIKMPVGSFEALKEKANGYEKALKDLSEAQSQIITIQNQYNKLLSEIDAKIKNEVANEKKRKTEKQSYVLTLKEALDLAQKEVHSINEANEANKRLRATIRTLRNDVKEEADAMKVLNDAVDRNSQVINENSDAYTRQKRNVGNYASAFNGLEMSIQQVIRELPAMSMGFNTFFLAISNNLPMLVDQLQAASERVKKMKEDGEKVIPVWKQLTKGIFNWKSLLIVGITVMSMHGKEIIEWAKNLFKGKYALDSVREAEQALHDARVKGYKDSSNERADLDLLYNASQDVNRSLDERIAAIDELRVKYPDYLSKFSNEEILAGKASSAYAQMKEHILEVAQAKALQSKIQEIAGQRLEKELEIMEKEKRLKELETHKGKTRARVIGGGGTAGSVVLDLTDEALEYRTIELAVNGLNEEIEKYDNLISKLASGINITDIISGNVDKGGKSFLESLKSPWGEERYVHDEEYINKIAEEYQKKLSDAAKNAMNNNLNNYSWESVRSQQFMNIELDELVEQYSKGLIDKEEYERRKVEITNKYAIIQAQLAIDLVKEQLNVANLSEEERFALEQELAVKEIELAEKVRDAKINTIKESNKAIKVSMEDMLSFAGEMLNGIGDLAAAFSEKKLQSIEEEEKVNDEAHEKEIERIEQLAERGAISEEEAEMRKRAAEEQTSKKQEELAKKRAEIQQRQAKLDKAISVSQTIINTALGIMTTIKNLGMPAAIPFIAMQSALGAIQLATILAQPIPKYAKGTKGHKGGLAIVGDGGKQEAVITDNGVWATPAVPTLVDIPKGAVVLPDLEGIKNMRGAKSDLLLLLDKKTKLKDEGVIVNVNNDYSRLEKRMDANSNELKQIKKLLKQQGLYNDKMLIYSRL